MTLDKAIELLRKEYEKAQRNGWVYHPLAYALYEVWKKADAEKGERLAKCGQVPLSTVGMIGGMVGSQNTVRIAAQRWKERG